MEAFHKPGGGIFFFVNFLFPIGEIGAVIQINSKTATRPDGDLAVYFPQRNWETML